MDELKELRDLVGTLEELTDKDEIVKQLQIIGRKLVTEYEIRAGGIVVKPLVVEAYYYNPETFPDCNTHLNPLQKKFNVLYRHSTKKGLKSDGRVGGVDICLALNEKSDNKDSAYYLSFLIKNSLVNDNEFYKQIALNAKLNELFNSVENIPNILYKREHTEDKICIYCNRKGLKKECYKDLNTAIIYPWKNINDSLDLSSVAIDGKNKGRGKQWRIAISNIERGNPKAMADKENKSSIEKDFWELAEKDYTDSKKIEQKMQIVYNC